MSARLRARAGRPAPAAGRRERRGAMFAYLAIFFTSTVLLGALTFDFARLANLKAELQSSADAAAHAGIQRLVRDGCDNVAEYNNIRSQAQSYAQANLAMQATVTVDSNLVGDWNTGTQSFTQLGACSGAVDAIRVVVSVQSSGLFMAIAGVTAPRVRAGATGYRCTSGYSATCATPRPVLVR